MGLEIQIGFGNPGPRLEGDKTAKLKKNEFGALGGIWGAENQEKLEFQLISPPDAWAGPGFGKPAPSWRVKNQRNSKTN